MKELIEILHNMKYLNALKILRIIRLVATIALPFYVSFFYNVA
jgi:hypothetical protein